MIDNHIVDNSSDKQKLLHIYLTMLSVTNEMPHYHIIPLLKEQFDFIVNERDLQLYFEPNFGEDVDDLKQQLNNLGIRYD